MTPITIPANPTINGEPVSARRWMTEVFKLAIDTLANFDDDDEAREYGLDGFIEAAVEMAEMMEEESEAEATR